VKTSLFDLDGSWFFPWFPVVMKTLAAVLFVTPALTFWYVFTLLLLDKLLPLSSGLATLRLSDVLSWNVVVVLGVMVAVMAAIFFTADMLERRQTP
jgi:hypothetical protein